MWAVRGHVFRGPTIIKQTLSNESSCLMPPVQVQVHQTFTVSCCSNEFASIQAFLKLLPSTNLHSSYNSRALGPFLADRLLSCGNPPRSPSPHAAVKCASMRKQRRNFRKKYSNDKVPGQTIERVSKNVFKDMFWWAGMFLEECNSL